MKKILPLYFALLMISGLSSCNDRFEGDEILNTDAVKIESVTIAQDTMDLATTQTLQTFSTYASNCEGFFGYDYLHTANLDRQVVSYKFKTAAACGDSVVKASQINFRPLQVGTYHFKFYTGTDSSGEDTWIEKEIVVQ